jgi:hypothetical protein
MANENARLRKINAEMLAALQYTLPILQDGLPETVSSFDPPRAMSRSARDSISVRFVAMAT